MEVVVDEFGQCTLCNTILVEMFCPHSTADVIDLDLKTVGDLGLAMYDPSVCGFVIDTGLDQKIHTLPKVTLLFRKFGVYPSQCAGLLNQLREVHRALLDLWRDSNLFPEDPGEHPSYSTNVDVGLNVYGGDGVAGH